MGRVTGSSKTFESSFWQERSSRSLIPVDEFFNHRSLDLPERIRRLEDWAATFAGRATNDPAVTQSVASGTKVVGGAGSGSAGGGSLAGDVVGPLSGTMVVGLQGFPLDLPDSTDDGQFPRFNFTAGTLTWETPVGSPFVVSVVTTTASTYLVTATDHTIFADASLNSIIVTMPDAPSQPGRQLIVKKVDYSANPVTLCSAVGDLIDDEAVQVLDSGQQSYVIESDGTGWRIVAFYFPSEVTTPGEFSLLAFWLGGAGSA